MQTTLGKVAADALVMLQNFCTAYSVIQNDAIEEWKTGSSKYSEETIIALNDGADWLQRAFDELWHYVFTPMMEGKTETHADHLHKFIDAPLEEKAWDELEDVNWVEVK